MNGENFMKWVQNRLIPAFEGKYTNGQKMILFLDNAPYHHVHGEGYVDVKNLKRADLFNELIVLAGKTHMAITRNGKEVVVDLKKHRKSKRGSLKSNVPVNPELRDELQAWLVQNPETQVGELQKLFDDQGWELLWTPPYTPQLQPIELCWDFNKGHDASKFRLYRTVGQAGSSSSHDSCPRPVSTRKIG